MSFSTHTFTILPIVSVVCVVVSAADIAHAQTVQSILVSFSEMLAMLLPMALSAALLAFFWGLIKYITNSGEDKSAGKGIMINGILALFVMVSIWGIVALLQRSFGIDPNAHFDPPKVCWGGKCITPKK
jgi:ethanolamine transporter EutH